MVAQTIKDLLTMQETRVQSLGQEDPLEKEMATHSSTVAWRISWMGEHDSLQSMGSQRVRHDGGTLLQSFLNYNNLIPSHRLLCMHFYTNFTSDLKPLVVLL